MPVTGITYTPNISNALYPAFVGVPKIDPVSFPVDPVAQITGQNIVQLENELLAHQAALSGNMISYQPNMLINGGFDVWQRTAVGTPTTCANNVYGTADRWYILTDGSATDLTTNGNTGTSEPAYCLVSNTNASSRHFGLVQIIESVNLQPLLDAAGNFSLSINAAGNAATLRAAVLGWNGTADTLGTSHDFIADWTHAADANPFTAFLKPVFAGGAYSSIATLGAEQTITVSGNMTGLTNLIVFIWSPSGISTGNPCKVSQCNLTSGLQTVPYYGLPFSQTLAMSQRYFEKSFTQGTPPAPAAGMNGTTSITMIWATTNVMWTDVKYQATKRVLPTVTFYNPVSANALWYGSGSADSGIASVVNAGVNGFQCSNDGTGTYAQFSFASIHWTSQAEI